MGSNGPSSSEQALCHRSRPVKGFHTILLVVCCEKAAWYASAAAFLARAADEGVPAAYVEEANTARGVDGCQSTPSCFADRPLAGFVSEQSMREKARRVVVTGMGALTPLGHTVGEAWKAAVAGVSGIGPITQFDPSGVETSFAGRSGGGIRNR